MQKIKNNNNNLLSHFTSHRCQILVFSMNCFWSLIPASCRKRERRKYLKGGVFGSIKVSDFYLVVETYFTLLFIYSWRKQFMHSMLGSGICFPAKQQKIPCALKEKFVAWWERWCIDLVLFCLCSFATLLLVLTSNKVNLLSCMFILPVKLVNEVNELYLSRLKEITLAFIEFQ